MAKNEFQIIINFVGDKINGPFKGYKIFENIYNFNNIKDDMTNRLFDFCFFGLSI